MKMYYAASYDIKEYKYYSGDVAIFSSELYEHEKYTYEADFECIDMSLLEDKECAQRIADYFYFDIDIDIDLADRLLSGHAEDLEVELCKDFNVIGYLQEIRGECAVKMGYDGFIESDCFSETMYIVPIFGRQNELRRIK